MFEQEFTRRGLIAVALAMLMTGSATGQAGMEPKEIFEKGINVVPGAGSSAAAVKYDVILERGERNEPVATSRRFVNGDKFRLRFEVNKDSFVYVLHRTLDGNPDQMERYTGAKGIRVIRDEDRSSNTAGKFQLLYPARNTGMNNRLTGRKAKIVPENGGGFQMDQDPGIEKLVIVVSPTQVDVSRMFSLTSAKPGTVRREDSDADLDNQLKGAEDNTMNSKGVCVGDCYAAPRAAGKPIIVNVDLRHYSR